MARRASAGEGGSSPASMDNVFEYVKHFDVKEAFLLSQLDVIKKFESDRIQVLNDQRDAFNNNISVDTFARKERQFQAFARTRLFVEEMREQRWRLLKNIQELKLEKEHFLDASAKNKDFKPKDGASGSSLPKAI